MSNPGLNVVLAGVTTRLVLESAGALVREADVVAFEKRLGHSLQAAYKEFLLEYNGGKPVSGKVFGRDDDPDVPYAHDDSVRMFFELPTEENSVASYEQLCPPQDHPWALPDDVLPIGCDAFGNVFAIELGERGTAVRFIDHERLDEPIESHRVLANDFLDFTLRFESVEEKDARKRAEELDERRRIESGEFPELLDRQCEHLQLQFGDVRKWIRRACLNVFDDKGFLALHADEGSRTVLDVFSWLAWAADGRAFRDAEHASEALMEVWFARAPSGFGLRGVGPAFVEAWWDDRKSRGLLEETEGALHLTDQAILDLVTKLRSYA